MNSYVNNTEKCLHAELYKAFIMYNMTIQFITTTVVIFVDREIIDLQ